MGGLESEISERTTDVLLESARFEPRSIRLTSRALGLSSDSSYRFERGVDPEGVNAASLRACALIAELAGGRLAGGAGEVRARRWRQRRVSMRHERLERVLGIRVEPQEVRRIFEGLGLELKSQTRTRTTVLVPSWRGDLEREIDLIEEVARIHGYERVPETTRIPVMPAAPSHRERCERLARRVLAGAGFTEVLTYSLVADSPLQRQQLWHSGAPMKLRNPVTAARTHLRLTLIPGLLEVKRFNLAHGVPRVSLFELGKVYLPRDTSRDELPAEKLCLGVLTDAEDGFFVLKGLLRNLLRALHVEGRLSEEPQQAGPFADAQSLVLRLGGELLGCLGVVRREVAESCELRGRPAAMELDFERLVHSARLLPAIRALPRYPAVERDVAVVVDEGVRWAELHACIMDNAPPELEAVEFFDVYRGSQVPEGKKSIAFSLKLRAADRTLTGEEADGVRDGIVAALRQRFGAQLRGPSAAG